MASPFSINQQSVKEMVEKSAAGHHLGNSSSCSIPASYAYYTNAKTNSCENNDEQHYPLLSSLSDHDSIPTIDFSLLMSPDPDQRSQAVQELGNACLDWGFFIVVNHGVPDDTFKAMMDGIEEFFNLTAEEKEEFAGKHVMDPIRCGTSFNFSVEKAHLWRDFLKCFVHPQFNFPHKPQGFSDVAREYCAKVREITRVLLGGISESLGLETAYLEKSSDFVSNGLQILSINYYPPCPQPDIAAGLPPHTEHGFLTLVAQNGAVDGLQTMHNGKWVPIHAPPNSFMVNVTDHLEIMSNGRYKSNIHRAMVNNNTTRISIAALNGPSLDCMVSPAPELLLVDDHQVGGFAAPNYKPMNYKHYIELHQSNKLDGKSCIDRVRLN